ncbi:Asp-tRNA(Asn)/Glu-tRNA(Gln) amidotransferase subunit GatC [Candidatus Woesearchaeota archaeon]|nr:MAG: Asp-tRNA(Asn)/Glu-tRNA(Gln) amidotransferase subunit GatC [Candidatus Woesearchaeota archaeon]
MKIDKNVMQKIAKNARLELTEEEVNEFLPQLNDVLEYFSILNEFKEDIEPAFHPISIKNVYRGDIVEPSLSPSEALSNAKNKKDNYFKGPKVLK